MKGDTTAGYGRGGRCVSDGHWGKTPGGVSAEAGRPMGCGLRRFLGAPGDVRLPGAPKDPGVSQQQGLNARPAEPGLNHRPQSVPRRMLSALRVWRGKVWRGPAGPARPGEGSIRLQAPGRPGEAGRQAQQLGKGRRKGLGRAGLIGAGGQAPQEPGFRHDDHDDDPEPRGAPSTNPPRTRAGPAARKTRAQA